MEFAISLGLAIFGALLSVILAERERILDWWRMRNEKTWEGEWYCSWQDESIVSSSWVVDKVLLSRRFGKLYIDVVEPGDGYEWRAVAVKKDQYLLATWYSTRPNAYAKGVFSVRIESQGQFWCGFQIGPAKKTKIVCGKVVFAKSTILIEKARAEFNKHI